MEAEAFNVLSSNLKFGDGEFKVKRKYFRGTKKAEEKRPAVAGNDEISSEMDFFNEFTGGAPNVEPKSVDSKPKVVEDSTEVTGPGEGRSLKKKYRLKLDGEDIPPIHESFEEIFAANDFPPFLRRNVLEHYDAPTAVQMQCIDIVMAGRDCICVAPTGTGKTAVYLLPLIAQVYKGRKDMKKVGYLNRLHALVVAPTRELANQIHRHLIKYSKGFSLRSCLLTDTDVRGKELSTLPPGDRNRLENRFDIVITTPMRLTKMVDEKEIRLTSSKYVIFDEADKLFAMGFLPQVDKILASLLLKSEGEDDKHASGESGSGREMSIAMFSATMYPQVEDLCKSIMTRPVTAYIGGRNTTTDTVKQKLIYVGTEQGKIIAMKQLMEEGLEPPVLIFVQSKERAVELYDVLIFECPHVDYIHSGRTPRERKGVVNKFRSGKIWMLITTELMARGIDVRGVKNVINFDFPQSVESYIHRVGRAGRAGMEGRAYTFFSEEDVNHIRPVANVMRESGCSDIPDWIFTVNPMNKKDRKNLIVNPPRRRSLTRPKKYERRRAARNAQKEEVRNKNK